MAKDLQHYFEEYLDFLSRIGRLIGRLQAYERLAASSIQLNHSLIRVFEEFFAFFRMTKSLFGTERAKSGIRRFVGSKLLRSNLWNAFKKETTTKIKAIEILCEEADEEARLAISERQEYHLENITAKLDTHVLDEGKKGSQSDIKGFGQWLSPIAVDEDLYALGQGRMEDSCGWVLKTTEFVRWEEHISSPEKLQVLWVSGLPGSGKTHISSFLVDYLQKFGTVGYFFCKTADQNKRTAESIIHTYGLGNSFLQQIISRKSYSMPIAKGLPPLKGPSLTASNVWLQSQTQEYLSSMDLTNVFLKSKRRC